MKKLLLTFIAIVAVSALFADNHQGSLLKTGEQVPEFSVTTLDGKEIAITELKGKVVLINFFATWCGPCMKELPEVQKQLWPKFKDENFVMVSIGREHTKEELSKWNKKKGFTFPIAPDSKREVYSKFASQYIPRNFIVDKSGKIIWQGVGFDQKELDEMMKTIQENL
ncbi:TlpA family protein disulfide reductase [Marinifilum caeruleilacunae]|uniref:TlpA family protein disulfide reductase n=1 Tax=Marinifilum caeruleilacunae TaxID=2499076 RepID=A0ABX1WVH2_9BACT|nr:TlpA disulfide reductase family protein [Marinifilum caeruleilacunae]NOU59899.1 TlpA family protein disulfide reductase [Marinifilum caeruleilacunae]